jgi:tetratricopeptide (TPR) repeat protein
VELSQQEQVLFEAARVLLATGNASEALELAAQLADRLAPEPRAYAKLVEGEAALAGNDPTRAVVAFQQAQGILDTWLGRAALGRALVATGAFPEAHAELENALSRRGEACSVFLDDVPSYHSFPQVHYWLGRALEGLGSPGAAEAYRTFIDIKATNDDDPLVADAKRRIESD